MTSVVSSMALLPSVSRWRRLSALRPALRGLRTSAIALGEAIPPPGDNLPFQIANRYRLTLNLSIFMATGFGLPFLMVRKKFVNRAY